MERIGAFLRREREARGLTLEDVVQRTRIQRSHLDAIERDDLGALPPGPFIKGFVTAYARVLGIKPDQVLSLLPELEDPAFAPGPLAGDTERRGPRVEIRELPVGGGGISRAVWVALLVLVLLGGGLVAAWRNPAIRGILGFEPLISSALKPVGPDKGGSSSSPAPADAAKARAGSSAGTAGKPAAGSSSGVAAASPAPASGEGTAAASPVAAAGGAAPVLTSPPPGTSLEAPTPIPLPSGSIKATGIQRLSPFESETDRQVYEVFSDPALKPGTQQVVVLKARHRSFVRVAEGPGKPAVYEGVMAVDESREFKSGGELWMVVGNAGGLEVTYNGQALSELGRDGEKKGFAFRPPQPK